MLALQPDRTAVADLMNCDVVSVTPETTVRELAGVLHRANVSGVPVLDENGFVAGVASTTDLLWLDERVRARADPPQPDWDPWSHIDEFRVRDIMTPDVFGVAPSTTVDELRRFFVSTGVHRALVLVDGALVGIVTASDLIGAMARSVPPSSAGALSV